MFVKVAARSVGSNSIGEDTFIVNVWGAVPDIVTGSINGMVWERRKRRC